MHRDAATETRRGSFLFLSFLKRKRIFFTKIFLDPCLGKRSVTKLPILTSNIESKRNQCPTGSVSMRSIAGMS